MIIHAKARLEVKIDLRLRTGLADWPSVCGFDAGGRVVQPKSLRNVRFGSLSLLTYLLHALSLPLPFPSHSLVPVILPSSETQNQTPALSKQLGQKLPALRMIGSPYFSLSFFLSFPFSFISALSSWCQPAEAEKGILSF